MGGTWVGSPLPLCCPGRISARPRTSSSAERECPHWPRSPVQEHRLRITKGRQDRKEGGPFPCVLLLEPASHVHPKTLSPACGSTFRPLSGSLCDPGPQGRRGVGSAEVSHCPPPNGGRLSFRAELTAPPRHRTRSPDELVVPCQQQERRLPTHRRRWVCPACGGPLNPVPMRGG